MSKSNRKRVARLSRILEENQWHSSLGFDSVKGNHQQQKESVANTPQNREEFIPAGAPSNARFASVAGNGKPGELLIHKASRALWRVSDDGRSIEPAFDDDIITIGDDNDE